MEKKEKKRMNFENECRGYIIQAWPNIKKMLIARNYDVHSKMPDAIDWDYTKLLAREKYKLIIEHEDTREKLVVYFSTEEKVGVKSLRLLVGWLDTSQVRNAIIYSWGGSTAFTSKAIKRNEVSSKYDIEVYPYQKVFFCLTEHELVKRHRILSDKEKQDLLEALCLPENKLPKLQQDKPLASYYKLKPGTVVEFIRKNGAQELVPFYRIVE